MRGNGHDGAPQVRGVRPGQRLAARVRRVGWLAAAAASLLLASGFSWTLARAQQAPATTAPLPPSEQQLMQQQDQIAQRIQQDQSQLANLEQQVQAMTSVPAAPAPGPSAAVPGFHSVTRAS